MARGLLLLVALFAVASSAAAQDNTKNTLLGLTGKCRTDYDNILSTHYANNTACADAITLALNTTVRTSCPETTKDSQVQKCMYNNGNEKSFEDWVNWIKGCEIMYIAGRTGAGESEEGLKGGDNSCFQLFNSLSQFQSYLSNGMYNSASATSFAAGTLVASVVGALLLVML